MAIAVVIDIPGVTQEEYEAVARGMGELPPEHLFHCAGPIEGGWRVFNVWASQEAADAGRQKALGLWAAHGVQGTARPTAWPLISVRRGVAATV